MATCSLLQHGQSRAHAHAGQDSNFSVFLKLPVLCLASRHKQQVERVECFWKCRLQRPGKQLSLSRPLGHCVVFETPAEAQVPAEV